MTKIKLDDALELSDEEFMKLDPSQFEEESSLQAELQEEDEEAEEDKEEEEEEDTTNPDTQDNDESDREADSTEDSDQATIDSKDNKGDSDSTDRTADDQQPAASGELTQEQYSAIGRQIMSEFKANGNVIKVKSAEDAIQLMQMGANYHKKMNGLKPSLKALKLLENNGLMDADKINYLIDLSQKKPEAIKKLLKDSNLDLDSFDLEEQSTYSPSKRTVNDTELILDDVLDSIQHSPKYNETLNVLGTKWDDTSKSAIASNPELIRVINGHMEAGIYSQVAAAVDYERSLGKLVGVSDLDAYQQIGGYMHENNLFKFEETPPAKALRQPQAELDPAQEEARRNRKKAASPSVQRKAPESSGDNYNPLAMSDEEFVKLNKLNI